VTDIVEQQQPDAFEAVTALLKAITDAAACGQRLADLKSTTAAATEAKIDLQLAQNELDAKLSTLAERDAAVTERKRALKIREFTFDQRVTEATSELRTSYLALTEADKAMKLRVMNFSGMLSGFDIGIREIPTWDAIEKLLGVAADPHMPVPSMETTQESWGGAQLTGTLTRSMPTGMAEHDDQPSVTTRPADPSGRSRRRSRLHSGGMLP
jgi:hypothetical protein